MLTAAIISSLATLSRGTLLVHGRGMACALWDTGGKPAEDCVHHKAPGAVYPGPWVGSLDPSTGSMAAIPGITTFFGSVEAIHSNFLSLNSTDSLGYVILNTTSGWYTTQLSLPTQKGESGAVKLLGKVTSAYWPPAWTALGGPHNIIGWTEIEFHSTASQGVRVQETLQLFDTNGQLTATLANLSAHGTDTHMAIPHYGFEHAVDTDNNLLYTQSQNQSVRVLDFRTNRTLPDLPNTAGKFFMCLHFDSAHARLGAIVATYHGAHQRLELVAVDVHTGATTTRTSWNQSSFLDKLQFLRHDDRPQFPPMCTFNQASGQLAVMLFDKDPAALRGWNHRDLYVSIVDTRHPTQAPPTPLKILFPWIPDRPLGNRTWRAFSPGLTFV